MYAKSGASDRHNVINENITIALAAKLREKDCRSASSDQRVYASLDPFFAYPDKVITCGEKKFLPDEIKDTLVNPVAIFEVLSASTRDYDLGLKGTLYRSIPSLRDYVAVEQAKVCIHHWERIGSGEWVKREYVSGTLDLSIGVMVLIEELYRDVF